MKLVKPTAVSFSFRTFQVLGQQHLCVTSLVGFSLDEGARRLVSDAALWTALGEATGGAVDEGLPKPRGEVLLYGSCHTPGGRPLPFTQVRLRMAPVEPPPSGESPRYAVDKRLVVFGDRYWSGSAVRGPSSERAPSSSESTEPVPFVEMPIGWERAFGGASHPENPKGRGTERIDVGDGVQRLPLPNVEVTTNLVTTSSQRPEPAGLGALDVAWPQRRAHAGTYDAQWLEEDFPGYARDTDASFFCTAPPDQRIEGFFRGDEEYVLENVHPSRPVLRGRLPGVAARVLVRRKGSEEAEEVPTRLDTVVFLPGKDLGVLVFRGMTPVLEDDAADVAFALAACEDVDAPRPTEHYAVALARRLDKDQSPLLALREDDLVPAFARGTGIAELLKDRLAPGGTPDPTVDRAMARLREELAAADVDAPDEAIARAARMPPGLEALAQLPDFADPDSVAAFEEALARLDAYGKQQVDEAEREVAKQIEQLEREGATVPVGGGPPSPQAPPTLAALRDAGVEPEPALVERLEGADADVLQMYRETAHYAPPVAALGEDERDRARAALIARHARGEGFAGLDCTRQDLTELDLGGADFRQALLEGADLTRADLAGVDLSGAVLAHATLKGTCLDGATLTGTNLGAARIDGASFAGAKLDGTVLARARVRSASFRDAELRGIDWLEAEIGAVDFEGAVAPLLTFLPKLDLTRCRFPRARLTKANFIESTVDGVDFSEADLELVTFLAVKADGADFRRASLKQFHAVRACSFEGACFDGADLSGAFLRGSNLRGASFEGARLQGADLSECDLTGAKLSAAQAREILLVRADLTGADLRGANLMEAMLQKAKLHGADLSETNLFAANLGLVRLDTATKVQGANLKRALMLPRARKTT